MKILHINSGDKNGGAGIAAYRLHRALLDKNQDSMMLVCNKITNDSTVHGPRTGFERYSMRAVNFINRRLTSFFYKPEDTFCASISLFDNPLFVRRINDISPDIVNLHWVCDGVIRPEFIAKINAPVVWTMHDMWPFCGSENYVLKSQRHIQGYSQKNEGVGSKVLDVDRWVFQRKKKVYAKTIKNISFIAPSRWLGEEAKKSALLKDKRVVHIPNGIDTNKFCPVDKKVAREILGLPLGKKILLYGATGGTLDSRKGFSLLSQALTHLCGSMDRESFLVTMFGGNAPAPNTVEYNCLSFGRLTDDVAMVLAYSAADVFVVPSLLDNLPNTILESLSCGTPVVGFNIGGLPDMINHEENGCLADPYNIESLANGIHYVFSNLTEKRMNDSARNSVVSNFSSESQAEKYIGLYSSLLS